MTDTEEFLASVLPRLVAAETALHNGDPAPRKVLWSRNDPATLFGAVITTTGWPEINATFDLLAARFSNCTSYEYEVISAAASGDLAHIVGFEHTTASIAGAPPVPYSLRVTTLLRREDGEWKVFHRHGDAVADSVAAATTLADHLGDT